MNPYQYIIDQTPREGFFREKDWMLSPEPLVLSDQQASELELIGTCLHRFLQAMVKIYREAPDGGYAREVLNLGKPEWIIALQHEHDHDLPLVMRPDLLITEDGFRLSEIDSLPGGIGLSDWLAQVYTGLGHSPIRTGVSFAEFFGEREVEFLFSTEAMGYEPEIQWLSKQDARIKVSLEHEISAGSLSPEQRYYRYFELWDRDLTTEHRAILARSGELQLTPPPMAILEEKLLLALFHTPVINRLIYDLVGEEVHTCLQGLIPKSWILDPSPLPAHAVHHGTEHWSWEALKGLSRSQRELVIKISGFSENAWGGRGVYIGHDLSTRDWEEAVDLALASYGEHPYVLQEFAKSLTFKHPVYMADGVIVERDSVVRVNPYYQVNGDEVRIGNVMAVICENDKKKIHGMKTSTFVPCCRVQDDE